MRYREEQYDELRRSRELEHVNHGVSDELAWCIQEVTGGIESTGCVSGQARQIGDRWACKCYGRRGVMYQRQTCRADSM